MPCCHVVQDRTFSTKSVASLDEREIARSICCIEQMLLLSDTSYSIHTDLLSSKAIHQSQLAFQVGPCLPCEA